MENSQRDLEKNRVKKEAAENLKSKWSVLFINSTGKVFTISYVKPLLIILGGFIAISIITISVLASFVSVSVKNNRALSIRVDKLEIKNHELKDLNQKLSVKLALVDPQKLNENKDKPKEKTVSGTDPGNNMKSEKTKLSEVKNLKEKAEKKNEENIKKDNTPVRIRNYSIVKDKKNVRVKFDIVNDLDSDKTVSGYIFAILSGDKLKDDKWLVSPFSEISSGIPIKPSNGQFFAISRFKPVTIKFPGNFELKKYNKVMLLVFSRDKKLVLKKGFLIDEK